MPPECSEKWPSGGSEVGGCGGTDSVQLMALQFPGPPWVIDRQEREAVLIADLRRCSCEPTLSESYTWAEEGGGPSALRNKAMNKPSQGEYRKISFYRRL